MSECSGKLDLLKIDTQGYEDKVLNGSKEILSSNKISFIQIEFIMGNQYENRLNIIDYEMDIEDAVESPRFHHQWLPDIIQFEKRGFSKETLDKLKSLGHKYDYRNSIGEANCIQILQSDEGSLKVGSGDSRRGGSAAAY